MRAHFLICGFLCGTIAASCSKPEPSASAPKSIVTPAATVADLPDAAIDACSLLTSDEIKAVQGEGTKETVPNRTAENGFVISQCYFSLPTAANSLTLRLVQRGEGAEAKSPRKTWRETFERDLKKAEEARGEGVSPPVQVPGVGDDAFWLGGPKGGGLYVLKGNRYFRLGLGGEPNQTLKIEKAKKLSASILQRL